MRVSFSLLSAGSAALAIALGPIGPVLAEPGPSAPTVQRLPGGSVEEADPEWLSPALFGMIVRFGVRYGVDPYVIAAMIWQESRWDSEAIGDNGRSVGLLQLHEYGAGAGLSVGERLNPELNLAIGVRELRKHLDEWITIEPALAAFNAGPTAMARVDGNWRALHNGQVAEEYVRPVLRRAEKYRREGLLRAESGLARAADESIRPIPPDVPASGSPAPTPEPGLPRSNAQPGDPLFESYPRVEPTPALSTDSGRTRFMLGDLERSFSR